MKEISITESGLSTMCRLCLSSDVVLSDIFLFSSKLKNSVAGVIMKCAAVQITRDDEMPNSICQSCYTQVERIHNFLMQIEKSDRTLRRYFQQIKAFDKPIKAECSVQPSEDNLIFKTNNDIVKCESLELSDVFNMDLNWKETEPRNFIQENKNNEEICLKTEIKVELIDDYLTECTAGTEDISSNINGKEFSCEASKIDNSETKVSEDITVKEKESENYIVTNKLMDEIYLKSEINDDKMDDNLLILTESVDDTENASSGGGNEISCEDRKINIGHASENSCSSANVTGNLSKCDETKKNISANKLPSYQCDICSKYFSGPSGLYYHKRTHNGEKPYKCNVCGKCFSQSCILNNHKLQHSGEKPYKCDLCNKCFSRSSNLNSHKLMHTGKKPYQCDFCNKCFSRSFCLNSHKLIHTSKKPYQCDRCNKCFSQSSDLNRHKLKHTDEKPFQCDICNKCFSRLFNLNTHKLIHTGTKPYQCDRCNKCFTQSSNLNKHKLKHTGESPNKHTPAHS